MAIFVWHGITSGVYQEEFVSQHCAVESNYNTAIVERNELQQLKSSEREQIRMLIYYASVVSSPSRERGQSRRISSILSLSVIHGNFKPSAEPAMVVRGKRTDDLQQPSRTSKEIFNGLMQNLSELRK